MNNFKSLRLIILQFIFCSTLCAQNWELFEQFPGTARDDASSFTIGEKVFCGSGRDNGFNCTRDFFVFDKATDSWINSASMPLGSERQYASGSGYNGKGYIFGGVRCDDVFLNDLWEYDEGLNNWTQLTSLPSEGRGGMQSFIIQDSLYIVGGRNHNGILKEVWRYDFITDTWEQKNDLPNDGIWRGTSFEYGGFGYIGLGKNNILNQTGHNTGFYKYDPINDTWEDLPDPGLNPRSYIGTVQVEDKVLFFGGVSENGSILSSFDRLELSTWGLQSLPAFENETRKGGVCFLDGNIFYYTTGVSLTQRYSETWRSFNTLSSRAQMSEELNIYPNPAQNLISVSLQNVTSGDLNLFSSFGIRFKCYGISETKHVLIDVSFLDSGIYYLELNGSAQCFSIVK